MAMFISALIGCSVLFVKHHCLFALFFVLMAAPYQMLNVKPRKKYMVEKLVDTGFMILLMGVFLMLPAIITGIDESIFSYANFWATVWFCGIALFMAKDAVRAVKEVDEEKIQHQDSPVRERLRRPLMTDFGRSANQL